MRFSGSKFVAWIGAGYAAAPVLFVRLFVRLVPFFVGLGLALASFFLAVFLGILSFSVVLIFPWLQNQKAVSQ